MGKNTRGTVGWPTFTEKNRHVLNIHGSQHSSLESQKLGGNVMWEPVSISIDKNEQTCAFWNDFIPSLSDKSIPRSNCQSKSSKSQNKPRQTIFLPMKIRPRSTTSSTKIHFSYEPHPTEQTISESISENYSKGQIIMKKSSSKEDVISRSKPTSSIISLNTLFKKGNEYFKLPSTLFTMSQNFLTSTTKSTAIITTTTMTTIPTTTTTTKSTTTTQTTTAATETTSTNAKPKLMSSTKRRMTTVTQQPNSKLRHPTVKFNPYIFVSGTMQSKRNRNEPQLRKEDVSDIELLAFETNLINKYNVSIERNKSRINESDDLLEDDIIESEMMEAKHSLRKHSLLFADDPKYVPLNAPFYDSFEEDEDLVELKQNKAEMNNAITDMHELKKTDDQPFVSFGENGTDSVQVKFQMNVGDNSTENSWFPKSRMPSFSTTIKVKKPNKHYSLYKSNNPKDSAIVILNQVRKMNESTYANNNGYDILKSKSKTKSKNNINKNKFSINKIHSPKQHAKDKSTSIPRKLKPYSSYTLPPVYDPFNTKTYLKDDHIEPRKTNPASTNKLNQMKIFDYFRARNDKNLISIKEDNTARSTKPFKNNKSVIKKSGYFPL